MPLNRRATIQWNTSRDCGCLRIGAGDYDHTLHLPFDRSCTVFRHEGNVAEIAGYHLPHSASNRAGIEPADWWAMALCLTAEGFEYALFERFDSRGQLRHETRVPLARFRRYLRGQEG
jgi:hypothetical protein